MVEVYSDVETLPPVPFKDSEYNPNDNSVVDAEGDVVVTGGVQMGVDNRNDVASGSFDRTSAPPKSFDMGGSRGTHDCAAKDRSAID